MTTIFMRMLRKFFRKAIQAWEAGGLLLRGLALYAFLSPAVVIPLASGKLLFAQLHVSWSVVLGLMVVGHFNTLVLIPSVLWWRSFGGRAWWQRVQTDSSSTPPS